MQDVQTKTHVSGHKKSSMQKRDEGKITRHRSCLHITISQTNYEWIKKQGITTSKIIDKALTLLQQSIESVGLVVSLFPKRGLPSETIPVSSGMGYLQYPLEIGKR
jgi:hypothetical protein